MKNFTLPIRCLRFSHRTHGFQQRRLDIIGLALLLALFLAAMSHPSLLQAGNPAVDRGDIIARIEQAQSLTKKEKFEQAIQQLVDAYNLADSRQDYLSSASLDYLIGEIYEHKGRFQQALIQYEQGLKILGTRQAGAAKIVGQALDQLRGGGKAYTPGDGAPISTDLYRGEIDNIGQRLAQAPRALEDELAVVLTMNVGNMYLNQNQYQQAEALYRKALEIARSLKQPLTAAQIQSNLAWGAIKQRQFDQADVWLKAAMSETDTDANLLESRRTLLALGVHYRETGRVSEAITELKKAAVLYELADDETGRCRTLAHLATAYQRQGDLQQAKTIYLQALELNRQVKDDTTAWHASGGLAKTYYKLGDLAAAVLHYENYMDAVDKLSRSYETDQGKVAILENHAAIAGEYVSVTVELARQTGDFIHIRKAIERGRARALKELLSWKQSRGRRKPGQIPAGPVLYGDMWPSIKMDSADYMPAQEAEGTMSSPMAQMAPGVASGTKRSIDEEEPAADDSQRVKPPLTPILQAYVLPEQTVVLVHSSKPDGQTGGALVEIKAESLGDLIARYRLSLDVDQPRGVAVASGALTTSPTTTAAITDEANLSRQLYDLLIKPVRKLLPADPEKPLVIIPHKSLWLLPFAALRDKNGDFFGDQHVLTYAASESTWRLVASRARSSDHRNPVAWIVGNPQMPARIESCQMTFAMEPLPGAEQEAREIAALFRSQKTELFTGFQADRLRLDAWHPQFSVLHLATHGVGCAANPLSSFLVLKALDDSDLELDKQSETISLTGDSRYPVTLTGARKILKSREMPEIKELSYPGLLDARSIINNFNLDADLVSLSACQTGLGQLTGEGMVGFTRAFLTSGARSLLVSLWRVDDGSTRELMVHFYRQYLEHGSKGLALQRAMAKTRERYPDPRYWAGFTLVGMTE